MKELIKRLIVFFLNESVLFTILVNRIKLLNVKTIV